MMNNNRIPPQYEFSELLKKDDLGSVSAVVEKKSGKLFIFKEISPSAGPDFVRRFLREAEVLAELSHPGIVKVQAFGDASNPYIILEYFKGKSLAELIRAGSLSPDDKKTVFASILSGIAYAHSADVIHRDIKPENILIGDDNNVKIIDFGLALRENESGKTAKGGIIGTPSYIAPEILNGEPASKSTDLFALGVTGIELFTGVNPFAGSDINDTINRLLSYDGSLTDYLTAALPEEFREIINSLTSLQPEQRFITADAVSFTTGMQTSRTLRTLRNGNRARAINIRKYAPAFLLFLVITAALIAASGNVFSGNQEPVLIKNLSEGGTAITAQPVKDNTTAVSDKSENGKDKDENVKQSPDNIPDAGEKEAEQGFGLYNINVMPWAKVFIDGSYAETTPLKSPLKIKSGKRKLTLSHPEFGEFETTLNVKSGSTGEFIHNFRSKSGYLIVNVFPWAEVFINEKPAGLTPFQAAIPLSAGEYKIKLKNPGFSPFEKTVIISAGDTLKLHHSFN
ncbi:MAG: serine/threonine protein kinase [Ignavibacteriaceae bacterium]|nr:serine/threonine protein kinase [Ignavibacteriaceae bacterium]